MTIYLSFFFVCWQMIGVFKQSQLFIVLFDGKLESFKK